MIRLSTAHFRKALCMMVLGMLPAAIQGGLPTGWHLYNRATEAGDRVSLDSGDKMESMTDFSVPVKYGMALEATRHYCSNDEHMGPLFASADSIYGKHWASCYEWELEKNVDGTVYTLYLPDRGHLELSEISSNYYESSMSTSDMPVKLNRSYAGGTYTCSVTFMDGTELIFKDGYPSAHDYKLCYIEKDWMTGTEERLTLDYDAYDRLDTVTAPTGDSRYIKFVYPDNSTYRSSKVQFYDGIALRDVIFHTFDGSSRLTEVRNNSSDATTYWLYDYGDEFDSGMDTVSGSGNQLARISRVTSGVTTHVSAFDYATSSSIVEYSYRWDVDAGSPEWVMDLEVASGSQQGKFGEDTSKWQKRIVDPYTNQITKSQHNGAGAPAERRFVYISGSARLDVEYMAYGSGGGDQYPLRDINYRTDSDIFRKYQPTQVKNYFTSSTDGTTYFTYCATSGLELRPATITYPEGNVITYTYYTSGDGTHKQGRLKTISDGTYETKFDYYTSGGKEGLLEKVQVKVSASPTYIDTTYDYDSNGNVTSITTPNGNVVTQTWNAWGLLASREESQNHVGVFEYKYSIPGDVGSSLYFFPPRMVFDRDPSNEETYYTCDAWRRVLAIDTPTSASLAYTYNGIGYLESITNGEGDVQSFEYDADRNLVDYYDGKGERTRYTYDRYGRLTAQDDYSGGSPDNYRTYTYADTFSSGGSTGSGLNLVETMTRGDGTVIKYIYDFQGRPKNADYGNDSSNELTYTWNKNGQMKSVADTRLTTSGTTYTWYYDLDSDVSGSTDSGKLVKFAHPEGYTNEWFYDAFGRLEAYRDADGGLDEYAYDANKELSTLTDPWLGVTTWNYAGSGDTAYPLGSLLRLDYSNGADNVYEYDTHGRLDYVLHRNISNSAVSYIDLTRNEDGLITNKARTWPGGGSNVFNTAYTYDGAQRLLTETYKQNSTALHTMTYTYDDASNRATMNSAVAGGSNKTTTYTYDDYNRLTTDTGYWYTGTTDTGTNDYEYDNNGNLVQRYYEQSGPTEITWDYTWNADDRLTQASRTIDDGDVQVDATNYAYDFAGRRILEYVSNLATQPRERSFFNGLTEEVRKTSIANGHADTAFAFTEKEDGVSASDWAAVSSGTAAAESNTARRSSVIKVTASSTSGSGAILGSAWNSTERVISFWSLRESGSGTPLATVDISTSGGSGKVIYSNANGSNSYSAGSRTATIYLNGALAPTSGWTRVERNIEADFESVSGATTWTNTDAITFAPQGGSGNDWWIDQIRLSNSYTSEQNLLGPGVVGHILANRTWASPGASPTKSWFHYDHVGSVMTLTGSTGNYSSRKFQDAFGNKITGWTGSTISGLWSPAGGWQHNTKEVDSFTNLTYMHQRWYNQANGTFLSRAPYRPEMEHQYSFAIGNPVSMIDPLGTLAEVEGGGPAFDNALYVPTMEVSRNCLAEGNNFMSSSSGSVSFKPFKSNPLATSKESNIESSVTSVTLSPTGAVSSALSGSVGGEATSKIRLSWLDPLPRPAKPNGDLYGELGSSSARAYHIHIQAVGVGNGVDMGYITTGTAKVIGTVPPITQCNSNHL